MMGLLDLEVFLLLHQRSLYKRIDTSDLKVTIILRQQVQYIVRAHANHKASITYNYQNDKDVAQS